MSLPRLSVKSYHRALGGLSPERLVGLTRKPQAILCWGKAAWDFYRPLKSAPHAFVIAPDSPRFKVPNHHDFEVGEHPLPGRGSLQAALGLIKFFMRLKSARVSRLDVYLSGGASSLAWLLPPGLSYGELLKKLEKLYALPLDIRTLNRHRAKLDVLKAGGALELARKIFPGLKIKVFCLSDVNPFGLECLGSGPFFRQGVPHVLLADNRMLRKNLAQEFRGVDSGFVAGDFKKVFQKVSLQIRRYLRTKKEVCLVYGCEPMVHIPKRAGRGGRQTHLGASLLAAFASEIREGRLEALCMSSDGVDGRSRASGVLLNQKVASKLDHPSLKRAIQAFDSGNYLHFIGALVPMAPTSTNVQDILVLRIT